MILKDLTLLSKNIRRKYYTEGAYIISEEDLAEEMLEKTEDRHLWETVEDRILRVRYVFYIVPC